MILVPVITQSCAPLGGNSRNHEMRHVNCQGHTRFWRLNYRINYHTRFWRLHSFDIASKVPLCYVPSMAVKKEVKTVLRLQTVAMALVVQLTKV